MNYYNEIDDYAANWIENLILEGLVPDGKVDRRSIADVQPDDLAGFTQCHFFAGIGGWSLALRLAGWPEDREVWTGSCPCQPFSASGLGEGFKDLRHLWPDFFRLIRERHPAVILGEQVAGKDAEPWLDLVWSDLESMGSAFGACAFPSASVGAPHVRDRTYWMGYSGGARSEAGLSASTRGHERITGVVDDAGSELSRAGVRPAPGRTSAGRLADGASERRDQAGQGISAEERDGGARDRVDSRPGPTNGFWRDADWLSCRDGKWRPVEPGSLPLVVGVPSRVGRLRAYGNAINPHQGAAFVEAVMECAP